jgi:hypothetical protein
MDRILTTYGAYIPVELLLALERLGYSDYEAWRCGRRPSLESVLVGGVRDAIALLNEAARWAEALGLRPERHAYFGWGDFADQLLVFCDGDCPEADAVLATHYVRPAVSAASGQLDIFIDSGAIAALADLRAALRARNPEAAGRCLATLAAIAPGHRLLPAGGRLVDALTKLSDPLPPHAVATELELMEERLLSAARDVLGPDARDLLAPFWQRLAAALTDAPFDRERPRLHASYAYTRCQDWDRAVTAVEATPGYAAEPVLLARLAKACRRNGDRGGGIAALCLLCWRFPTAAAESLDDPESQDLKVREVWTEFRDLDLDPPPETGLFPARFLLSEPGLARVLAPDLATGNGSGECAFRAVLHLLHGDSIEARKSVRAAAPWLLEAYLRLHF